MSILEEALNDCKELCDGKRKVSDAEVRSAVRDYKRQILILKIKGFFVSILNSIFYPVKK